MEACRGPGSATSGHPKPRTFCHHRKLGISLATKTVGCALGIAAAPVTGGFSAAVGCGALIIGGAQEVITYMKSQVRPPQPSVHALTMH